MTGNAQYADVNGIRVAYEVTGSGFPVLLLHGFPRTRRLWSRVAPLLASSLTVVAADRRGYGDSERPAAPAAYDSGTLAADAVELARHLGFERFLVVGHDRGAPVARRLAADHADQVAGAVIMDSLPQGAGYEPPRDQSGRSWYLDFFKQRGVAEAIIGQNPGLFFSLFISRHQHLSSEERQFYEVAFSRPGSTAAVLADYRAGFDVDGAYWNEAASDGRKIQVPVYLMWAAAGPVGSAPVLDIWRTVATDVDGTPIENTAHYIPEQQPEATAEHIRRFASKLGLV